MKFKDTFNEAKIHAKAKEIFEEFKQSDHSGAKMVMSDKSARENAIKCVRYILPTHAYFSNTFRFYRKVLVVLETEY